MPEFCLFVIPFPNSHIRRGGRLIDRQCSFVQRCGNYIGRMRSPVDLKVSWLNRLARRSSACATDGEFSMHVFAVFRHDRQIDEIRSVVTGAIEFCAKIFSIIRFHHLQRFDESIARQRRARVIPPPNNHDAFNRSVRHLIHLIE